MKEIILTKGFVAIVDDEDFEELNKVNWCVTSHGYANRAIRLPSGKQRKITMHRVIMNPPDGLTVDHINHNRLDNRRENLRIVRMRINQANRKEETFGTHWHKKKKRWCCKTSENGKQIHLGYFDTKEEGQQAYKNYIAKLNVT